MRTFVLAGGCFWCLDAAYRPLKGVTDVVSGYIGGTVPNPSYEQVCTGTTGHAEAVAVTFDPAVIPEDVILDAFFTMHDPRHLNRQGDDVGTQYRSAMFPADDGQSATFEDAMQRAEDVWDGAPVTTLEPPPSFTTLRTIERRTKLSSPVALSPPGVHLRPYPLPELAIRQVGTEAEGQDDQWRKSHA